MKQFVLVLSFLLFGVFSCQIQDKSNPNEQMRFLMDTVVRISIYPQGLSEKKIDSIVNQIFRMMEEMEIKMSTYMDSSDVSRINSASGQRHVQVSPDVVQLLKTSIMVSENSEGLFDVTIGVIKNLWKFDSDLPVVPDPSLIEAMLPLVNYQEIQIEGDSVMLKRASMQLDLGAIAKGYIIDRGIEILNKNGVKAGIIDAGGDLRIVGSHPTRKTWRIGIRDPRGENGELYGVFETNAISVATSGDYERYFIQDGITYHHILDPRTGYPANACVSVTIAAEQAAIADAYATTVFVLGPERGMALIERMPGIEGLILYEVDGQLQFVGSDAFVQKLQFQ
ncbi:FAD:protein FMN transferase [bacterium]|nr:FAD:protein FMN transferase [bacterium]RQV98563.1 MAG: FAD:protein FMN transferase [bacterium]